MLLSLSLLVVLRVDAWGGPLLAPDAAVQGQDQEGRQLGPHLEVGLGAG